MHYESCPGIVMMVLCPFPWEICLALTLIRVSSNPAYCSPTPINGADSYPGRPLPHLLPAACLAVWPSTTCLDRPIPCRQHTHGFTSIYRGGIQHLWHMCHHLSANDYESTPIPGIFSYSFLTSTLLDIG